MTESRSSGEPFAVQPQSDGTFHVMGLRREPIVISWKQAKAMLAWMQSDGIHILRLMLTERRYAENRTGQMKEPQNTSI
jgi:hypothetical protein